MPIRDSTTFEAPEFSFYHGEDEDEAYLKKLSVHGPVLPTDFKFLHNEVDPLTGHREATDDELENPVDPASLAKSQELLVKGFDVDPRIVPGFSYTVRYAGTNNYLFNGEARQLQTIGLGYGKRLTFKGDRLNNNDCYFWSDSAPEGFVFNLVAVNVDDVFTIYDEENCAIGEAVVNYVDRPQVELDTTVSNGTVSKRADVRLAVSVRYFAHSNKLVDIVASQGLELVEGTAVVEKARGSRVAQIKCIEGISLLRHGLCSFHKDT